MTMQAAFKIFLQYCEKMMNILQETPVEGKPGDSQVDPVLSGICWRSRESSTIYWMG